MDFDNKIDIYKNKLLDLGKRNKLINYKDTKRTTLQIEIPNYDILFSEIVLRGREFSFLDKKDVLADGFITSVKSYNEQFATLVSMSDKFNTTLSEQGINTLFLAFGFLNWTQQDNTKVKLVAPLILVPINITHSSINEPFKISLLSNDIYVNPTLAHKLKNEYNIELPQFSHIAISLTDYLNEVQNIVFDKGFTVDKECAVSVLSFLKINIYNDLEDNREKIKDNQITRAILGDKSAYENMFLEDVINEIDHDQRMIEHLDYNILDADSSQLDAIYYANKGYSFVLIGPPGTGKSQTITNIISNALANNKKILFVCEKMAAIDIVHRRLSEAGLSDFCLSMHNPKTDKRDILENLATMLSLPMKVLESDEITDLKSYEDKTAKYSEYYKELNYKHAPINFSINEVCANLSSLEKVPDYPFVVYDAHNMDINRLTTTLDIIGELSNGIIDLKVNPKENPWNSLRMEVISKINDSNLQVSIDDVLNTITKTKNLLEKIYNLSNNLNSHFHMYDFISINEAHKLVDIINTLKNAVRFPEKWLDIELDGLKNYIQQVKELDAKSIELENNINIKDGIDITNIKAEDLLDNLHENIKVLKNVLNKEYFKTDKEVVENANSMILDIINIDKVIVLALQHANKLSSTLECAPCNTINDIIRQQTLIQELLLNPMPANTWFNKAEQTNIEKLLYNAIDIFSQLNDKINKIKETFRPEIIDVDYNILLHKFNNDYKNRFKSFNKQYQVDRERINNLLLEPFVKIEDKFIITALLQVEEIAKIRLWIKNNHDNLVNYFGVHYKGESTNWKTVENNFFCFLKIQAYFGGEPISQPLKDMLIHGKCSYDLLGAITLEQIVGIEDQLITFLPKMKYNFKDIKELHLSFKVLHKCLINIIKSYTSITEISKDELSYEDNIKNLSEIKDLNEIFTQFNVLKIKIQGLMYGQYEIANSHIHRNWDNILNSVKYAMEVKKLKRRFSLSNKIFEKVNNEPKYVKNILDANNLSEDLGSLSVVLEEFKQFKDEYNRYFDNYGNVEHKDINEIIININSCLSTKNLLIEWINYNNKLIRAREYNVFDFISLVSKTPELREKETIKMVFLKGFYKQWLQVFIGKSKTLTHFIGQPTENILNEIREFNELDERILGITAKKAYNLLHQRIPDFDAVTNISDEIGILKRELSKPKNTVSLKALIKEIPNLLQTLKPCMMMSPLSVSVFLNKLDLDFDLVIFDEASQIATEDALCSLARAKQVIISGDLNQLPPNNFFSSVYESTQENYDVVSFPSILDDALKVIPEKTLRLHYRSKNEDLITFSNKNVYKNSLVTFPSPQKNSADIGVEYVYVKDGIYDRGGSKQNIKEAYKVAVLVFEHISKYPNRSLGIITFSEAQQRAVASIILSLRKAYPEYEEFFKTDKQDAFFIKSLENVQGDERDSIIFSIGYAKDKTGVLHLNFGPLSKNGGFRRLNVAITRARYNIKLVGSILPADINDINTNALGVKMLKDYMDYAMNINVNTDYNDNKVLLNKHDFVRCVGEYLISKGYDVKYMVGNSQFKVDLAVVNPSDKNKFILGIITDTKYYVSARTVKEREHLTPHVLSNMGWDILRLFNIKWTLNPTVEKDKLIVRLETLIKDYQNTKNNESLKAPVVKDDVLDVIKEIDKSDEEYENYKNDDTKDNKLNHINQELESFDEATSTNELGFYYYTPTNLEKIRLTNNYDANVTACIRAIIAHEYPVHIDYICRRINDFMNNHKISGEFTQTVVNILNGPLKNQISMQDNFYYPINMDKVPVYAVREGQTPRPIQHISLLEIIAAMEIITTEDENVTKSNLCSVTAKSLGYTRAGININRTMEQAMEMFVMQHNVRFDGEKIVI